MRGILLMIVAVVTMTAQVRTPDETWVGQRIVMLHGFGAVHISGKSRTQTTVGINIVSVVTRIEGTRVWVRSTGGDATGWIRADEVVLLSNARPVMDAAIARDPTDWDAYLRRAEVEHAVNDRDAATHDYTRAIELHPTEAFLFLRRARHYATLKDCARELQDLRDAIRLVPQSARQDYNLTAELYSLESGVYAGCAEGIHDPHEAIATARKAVALDKSRPTLLTILAAAYASAGDFTDAFKAQQQALQSKAFPPGYRADAERQLQEYERRLHGN